MPIKYVYCDYCIVAKQINRPLQRKEKLDNFVLMNKQITYDDIVDLGFTNRTPTTLKYCTQRTGRKFVSVKDGVWNIVLD